MIRNYNRIQQINDFSELKFGNIYPTDLDGFYEIRKKLFIIIEFKFGDTKIPLGQELAFRNLCDCLWHVGEDLVPIKIPAYFIHCTHNSPPDEPVYTGSDPAQF